ncbi:retrovirus-related pol polyprotein from transposon TNT 1-94 [Tanacetum coccineum]
MDTQNDDLKSAGSDTLPPMLDKTDFASWQQRIRFYCQGKDNGINILKSINEGPFVFTKTRDTVTEGVLGPERDKLVSELTDAENERYKADIRAINIMLQGLPKDIYTLINHHTTAKDIWDNVQMILEGSEMTRDERESQLYDDFEHFQQKKGEPIYDYYIRFSKLVNDMRNIKMTMPKIQLNSKFVNNMQPEWGRFIIAVKLNRGLKNSNHDQLYAYLKQHEEHAKENRMITKRFSQNIIDPLAFVSNVSQPSSSNTPQFAGGTQLDTWITPMDDLLNNLTKTIALLLNSYKSHLPQTNNQLRTASNTRNQATIQNGRVVVQNVQGRQQRGQGNNPRGANAARNGGVQNRGAAANPGQANSIKCYNCNGFGHIARNCTQPKRPQNSDYFKDKILLMQAQENGVVLDDEQLLFLANGSGQAYDDEVDEEPIQDLAQNKDNIFQADQIDAFDSDVDEAPTTQTMFMANLTSTGPVYDESGPSYDSDILFEVHEHDIDLDTIGENHEV